MRALCCQAEHALDLHGACLCQKRRLLNKGKRCSLLKPAFIMQEYHLHFVNEAKHYPLLVSIHLPGPQGHLSNLC